MFWIFSYHVTLPSLVEDWHKKTPVCLLLHVSHSASAEFEMPCLGQRIFLGCLLLSLEAKLGSSQCLESQYWPILANHDKPRKQSIDWAIVILALQTDVPSVRKSKVKCRQHMNHDEKCSTANCQYSCCLQIAAWLHLQRTFIEIICSSLITQLRPFHLHHPTAWGVLHYIHPWITAACQTERTIHCLGP